jgi:hypothetical protein
MSQGQTVGRHPELNTIDMTADPATLSTVQTADEPSPIDRCEPVASWILRIGLPAILSVLCLVLLAGWIPQYLTWPYFTDHDVFATMAREWDRGRLPYRDYFSNNPPGQVYLFYLLGKAFGWGWIAPFNALDAGFLATLGAVMLAWSRRCLGGFLPGLVGYIAFLCYYMDLDYSLVGQRDWQGSFFAVVGLLVTQAWPGRPSRWFSAATMAVALIIRPQLVLLVPAMAVAIDEQVRGPGKSWRSTVGGFMEWGLVFVAVIALCLLPLARDGVFFDLIKGMAKAGYQSKYSMIGSMTIPSRLLAQLWQPKIWGVVLAIVLLARRSSPAMSRPILCWVVAQVCFFFYVPLSPRPHMYLQHPITLVWTINLAVLAHLVAGSVTVSSSLRLVGICLVMGLAMDRAPDYMLLAESRFVFGQIRRSGMTPTSVLSLIKNPPGYSRGHSNNRFSVLYPWKDYRAAILYLREKTSPETRVANVLTGHPAIAAPTDRAPVFPAESIAWLVVVNPDAEDEFAQALERTPDSVVVWSPSLRNVDWVPEDEDATLAKLHSAIRRLYEPEARFGDIEIWRRKPAEGRGG